MNATDRFSLKGKTALVTGAGSGFGAHFASVLAGAGAKVACAARRADRLDAVVKGLRANGATAFAQVMDISDRASINAGFDAIEKALGDVDIVVNNAGQSAPAPFPDMTEEQWQSVLDVNLSGAFRVSQEMARRAIAHKHGGSIVNVASIMGMLAKPWFANYGTTKAALIQLTKHMAMDLLPHGIRVNALAPGFFSTEMTSWYFETDAGKAEVAALPAARLGRFDELDGPLLLLASDAGSYMNGAVIPVDYGHAVRLSQS